MAVTAHLGTGPPGRGPGRRRGESSHRVMVSQGLAGFDKTDPQAVSKLGHQTRRSLIILSDWGARPTLRGKVRGVVADVGGQLPGAAIHGGLLHALELELPIGRA